MPGLVRLEASVVLQRIVNVNKEIKKLQKLEDALDGLDGLSFYSFTLHA